jgi:methylmalonyl-CoA/ethylmalonyl-CoA epimerase
VADVAAALRSLASAGVEVIDQEPRLGLGGHEVSFIHPDSIQGVLVEVIGA